MERFIHSLKVFWRAERLLKTNELQLNIKKVQLSAGAALVGLFGLVMLTMAIFFTLVPYWGQAGAALAIAGIDLVLAVLLIAGLAHLNGLQRPTWSRRCVTWRLATWNMNSPWLMPN